MIIPWINETLSESLILWYAENSLQLVLNMLHSHSPARGSSKLGQRCSFQHLTIIQTWQRWTNLFFVELVGFNCWHIRGFVWILDSHIAHLAMLRYFKWLVCDFECGCPNPKKTEEKWREHFGWFVQPRASWPSFHFKHYKDEVPISSRLSDRGTSKSLRGLALGWTCRLAPACVKVFFQTRRTIPGTITGHLWTMDISLKSKWKGLKSEVLPSRIGF